MTQKTLAVRALAALLALSTPAVAPAQPYPRTPVEPYPFPGEAAEGTEIRVSPPPGGSVYIYEGHRLLERLDRPGSVTVPTGGTYRVVAMRGDTQIWAGDVTASGPPIQLGWAGPPRHREPLLPEPLEGQGLSVREISSLLRRLDTAGDDLGRLVIVSEATRRAWVTTSQADWILSRFRSDAFRLAALERLGDHLGDREDAQRLLQRFSRPGARQEARAILGYGP